MKRQNDPKKQLESLRQSYLLRLWYHFPSSQWHMLLQKIDGERHTFTDLTELMQFLEKAMADKMSGEDNESIQ